MRCEYYAFLASHLLGSSLRSSLRSSLTLCSSLTTSNRYLRSNLAFGQFELKASGAGSGMGVGGGGPNATAPSSPQSLVTGYFRASFRAGTDKLLKLDFSVDDVAMVQVREVGARLPSFPSVISFPVLNMSDR